MKARSRAIGRACSVLGLAAWAAGYELMAQIPPVLDARLYAGLSITGAVGTVYSIDYVTDLAQTNDPTAWRCLEYLQLPTSPYLWADKSAPATNKRFYRAVAMEAPTNMVFIPPGTFRMGSPEDEVGRQPQEGPQTDVILSRGFWMGKWEVTQGDYLAVVGSNPSRFNGGDYGVDLRRPVERVSYEDAVAYCDMLTERERAGGSIPASSVYRLPTKVEWEYACRAWSSTRFSYGDDSGYTNLTKYAWYLDNSGETTHPVGQKMPNQWGLYDMHGNVWEWCLGWWGDPAGGITIDPQETPTGECRVFRGGAWGESPVYCRSADREPDCPAGWPASPGFRIVLAPGQ